MNIALAILFLFLQFLDIYTTNYFLKHKTGVELNPIMAKIQKIFGNWWVVPKLVIVIVIIVALLYVGLWGMIGLIVLDIIYIYVVINNLILIKKGQTSDNN